MESPERDGVVGVHVAGELHLGGDVIDDRLDGDTHLDVGPGRQLHVPHEGAGGEIDVVRSRMTLDPTPAVRILRRNDEPRVRVGYQDSRLTAETRLHIEEVSEVGGDTKNEFDDDGAGRRVPEFDVLAHAVTDPTTPDHQERVSFWFMARTESLYVCAGERRDRRTGQHLDVSAGCAHREHREMTEIVVDQAVGGLPHVTGTIADGKGSPVDQRDVVGPGGRHVGGITVEWTADFRHVISPKRAYAGVGMGMSFVTEARTRRSEMSIGLFAVTCPGCGSALSAQRRPQQCAVCSETYLVRCGHVLKVTKATSAHPS